jgi:non-heme chloroperoxidase
MPTLVIHGVKDETVPIDLTGRTVAKTVNSARLIEYEDGAHGIFASHKERLIGDLLAFLGGSEASARSEDRTSETVA